MRPVGDDVVVGSNNLIKQRFPTDAGSPTASTNPLDPSLCVKETWLPQAIAVFTVVKLNRAVVTDPRDGSPPTGYLEFEITLSEAHGFPDVPVFVHLGYRPFDEGAGRQVVAAERISRGLPTSLGGLSDEQAAAAMLDPTTVADIYTSFVQTRTTAIEEAGQGDCPPPRSPRYCNDRTPTRSRPFLNLDRKPPWRTMARRTRTHSSQRYGRPASAPTRQPDQSIDGCEVGARPYDPRAREET